MTDIEIYTDLIISLVQDPNLSKDKCKSSELIRLIHEISERRINRLCSTSFIILQELENIQLKFKSWEFLSLDFNSDNHFSNDDNNIKDFNAGVANKVISACTDLNVKIAKISSDIDLISKNSRTLSPKDLMSDAGTMLTSLLLRIIKLKNDVVEQLSISYSKARLIIIGEELEMWEDENTVMYYKSFIVALLQQLNDAVEQGDGDAKYECLAVINDLEKMFEKFRIEKLIDKTLEDSRHEHDVQEKQKGEEEEEEEAVQAKASVDETMTTMATTPQSTISTHGKTQEHLQHHFRYEDHLDSVDSETDYYDKHETSPDDMYSEYSMFSSSPQLPMVHSITSVKDQDSISNYHGSITEELPYLMTAFSSAKNFTNDVKHYKLEEEKENKPVKTKPIPVPGNPSPQPKKPFFHKTNLPNSSLYSESNVIHPPLYSSSVLRTFGIKPQVISVPKDAVEKKKTTKDKPLLLTEENISNLTQQQLRHHDYID